MSAKAALCISAVLLASGAAAADEKDLPDEDFLEYLGSWEESDEDWLMFEKETKKKNKKKRDDSKPDGEESAETNDES